MSQLITNEQKLNDIIFAGRNKEYGAYELRSDYGNTVFKSLSLMIIGVVSAMSIAFYLSNKDNKGPDLSGQVFIHDSIYVIPFDNTEKEEPEPAEAEAEKSKPSAKPETSETTSNVISDSADVVQTTTVNVIPSINTSTLESAAVTEGSAKSTGNGTSNIVAVGHGTITNEVKNPFEVDSDPVFEGGLPALHRFIASNLKYPQVASDLGKEGTIYVKFVVDEEGKVGRLNLLNSVGYGLDDEAFRVVSIIPKFQSPAKIKGVPVKVYFQIPIRFRFR